METSKISQAAGDLLKFLNDGDLKADEKIAALKSAASTIEHILCAESFKYMMARALDGRPK